MPPAQLTAAQQQFLEDYKRKHSFIYPKKVSESEGFLRRKGKVLDALDAVPKFAGAAQNLRQSVLAADTLADRGDFDDPTNDLQRIDQDLQDHLKRAKGASAEAAAARQTLARLGPQVTRCGAG